MHNMRQRGAVPGCYSMQHCAKGHQLVLAGVDSCTTHLSQHVAGRDKSLSSWYLKRSQKANQSCYERKPGIESYLGLPGQHSLSFERSPYRGVALPLLLLAYLWVRRGRQLRWHRVCGQQTFCRLNDLGYKPAFTHQLKGHLITCLHSVGLREEPPSLHDRADKLSLGQYHGRRLVRSKVCLGLRILNENDAAVHEILLTPIHAPFVKEVNACSRI